MSLYEDGKHPAIQCEVPRALDVQSTAFKWCAVVQFHLLVRCFHVRGHCQPHPFRIQGSLGSASAPAIVVTSGKPNSKATNSHMHPILVLVVPWTITGVLELKAQYYAPIETVARGIAEGHVLRDLPQNHPKELVWNASGGCIQVVQNSGHQTPFSSSCASRWSN